MENLRNITKQDVKNIYDKSRNKNILIVAASFVALSLLITFATTNDMQHPVMHWLLFIGFSLAFLFATHRLANSIDAFDASKKTIPIMIVVALYFILTIGVPLIANNNRVQGIPKEVLITATGRILDADKFIDFHKKVEDGSNKIYFDTETESYIRENNALPDWVVIGGYTADPVSWVKAHPNASKETIDEVMTTRKVK